MLVTWHKLCKASGQMLVMLALIFHDLPVTLLGLAWIFCRKIGDFFQVMRWVIWFTFVYFYVVQPQFYIGNSNKQIFYME